MKSQQQLEREVAARQRRELQQMARDSGNKRQPHTSVACQDLIEQRDYTVKYGHLRRLKWNVKVLRKISCLKNPALPSLSPITSSEVHTFFHESSSAFSVLQAGDIKHSLMPWAFKLSHTSYRQSKTMYFAASSQEDMQGWMHDIACEIKAVKSSQGNKGCLPKHIIYDESPGEYTEIVDEIECIERRRDGESYSGEECTSEDDNSEESPPEDALPMPPSVPMATQAGARPKVLPPKVRPVASVKPMLKEPQRPLPLPPTTSSRHTPKSRHSSSQPFSINKPLPALPVDSIGDSFSEEDDDDDDDDEQASAKSFVTPASAKDKQPRVGADQLRVALKGLKDKKESDSRLSTVSMKSESKPEIAEKPKVKQQSRQSGTETEDEDKAKSYWSSIYYEGTKEEAFRLMKKISEAGTFLVRRKQNEPGVLGFYIIKDDEGNIAKYQLLQNEDKHWTLKGKSFGATFDTVEELIFSFFENPLPCDVLLKQPYSHSAKYTS